MAPARFCHQLPRDYYSLHYTVTSHTKTGNNSTWKEISREDLNRWENKNKQTNKWRAINRERRRVLFAIDALLTAQDVQRAVRVL